MNDAEWWRAWVLSLHRPALEYGAAYPDRRAWFAWLRERYGHDAVSLGGHPVDTDDDVELLAPTVAVDINTPAPTDACASWPRGRCVPRCIGCCE